MAFYFVSTFAIAQTPTKQPALRLSRTKNLHFAKATFPGFSADALRSALKQSDSILYLADNAGETVFDRVLIETLGFPVSYVVKAAPIINDATRKDAVAAGIDRVANIIDNGSGAPGTLLDQCSKLFCTQFAEADLIIAKGQANYESLSNSSAPIFFLLQAKCNVIARDLWVVEGGTILKRAGVTCRLSW
jgi:uncharacterized protein with ATP-grasp and redox domains